MKSSTFKAIVLIIVICSVLFADTAYDKWSNYKSNKVSPKLEDYDELINNLEQGIKELKNEQETVRNEWEKTTFVSIAALRDVGYELDLIEKPIEENVLVFIVTSSSQICSTQFNNWVKKAKDWDERKNIQSKSRMEFVNESKIDNRKS